MKFVERKTYQGVGQKGRQTDEDRQKSPVAPQQSFGQLISAQLVELSPAHLVHLGAQVVFPSKPLTRMHEFSGKE